MTDRKKESLRSWTSFLGVIYRLAIIIGLLFTIGTVVALIIIDIVPLWTLIFPVSLILFGVILAWIEYRLYRKLMSL